MPFLSAAVLMNDLLQSLPARWPERIQFAVGVLIALPIVVIQFYVALVFSMIGFFSGGGSIE
jgi:hypothetical protein